jgi:prepilin-type N-terminal cleavage/methylation domain-containing protein
MRNNRLLKQLMPNKKGVTLIELLVVLVISGIVVGGIYRVFVAQTKAYTVQDQVAEIQQDVRGAMDIMVRDIQMAGFQTNNFALVNPNGSALISSNRIVTPLNDSAITVYYEYNDNSAIPPVYEVTYQLIGGSLWRTLYVSNAGGVMVQTDNSDLLDNVTNLNFSYGIDANGDGIIDGIDPTTGITPNSAFQNAAYVNGLPTATILAVYIQLTAKPTSGDPDVTTMVSPRTLTSVVIPRNIFFKRYQAY